ncbi:MAG: EF-hand domain-containing protein [Microcystis sp. LE19-114.1B]|nr:EF-hand domain-containing protein [Microcystis sp. LE19-114.1B]
MFAQIPERSMHYLRWVVTIAWLILIFSLFFDPISAKLTDTNNLSSPLRVDPDLCIKVQGVCLPQSSYQLGAPIFWGIVVPSGIFILLVFGHELWRRICPLSFLSQIPRALGKQRQKKQTDKSGKVRSEIYKVPKNSWLARNYLYLQFSLLFLGLCGRILFYNSDRLVLGSFLILTILAAIFVGYWYGGKSWCNYFCPMSPVQRIYGEPRGLLNSTAHEDSRGGITQSMCRIVREDGSEQSACVACQSPCIDIDAERSYWDGINNSDRQWLYYGYFGLVFGYFIYYYLYAGNWDYYFSGAWARDENQLESLFKPGFYLAGQAIAIPKLVTVPLTLAICTFLGYFLGKKVENAYKVYRIRKKSPLTTEIIRHRVFTVGTFLIFNFFFIFGGRPFINLLPKFWHYLASILLAVLSSLWLYRTWTRDPGRYQREGLAGRLRKQLGKLGLDTAKYLDGRSLEALQADEVYVLAKILPDFTHQKRLKAYKAVLKEALEEGYTDFGHSLEILQQMRLELTITEAEHQAILTELGVESAELLDPEKQYSREDWLRLQSYRDALLESLLVTWKKDPDRKVGSELLEVLTGKSSREAIEHLLTELPAAETGTVESLRREYGVTGQEEETILHRPLARQLWQNIARAFQVFDRLSFSSDSDRDQQERILLERFQLFDSDSSGQISLEELKACLQAIEPGVTDKEIEAMLQQADTSRDNQISFQEFRDLLHQFHK